jgi:hypothetical protein
MLIYQTQEEATEAAHAKKAEARAKAEAEAKAKAEAESKLLEPYISNEPK